MTIYYNVIFFIFSILAFLMILDGNVADYFLLLIKFSKLRVEKYLWLMSNHPFLYFNPISKRILDIKYYLIARKLKKELEKTQQ